MRTKSSWEVLYQTLAPEDRRMEYVSAVVCAIRWQACIMGLLARGHQRGYAAVTYHMGARSAALALARAARRRVPPALLGASALERSQISLGL
jgi:hypothetical protein